MSDYFCLSVTFLDPRFHGCSDGGEPEWPPSPLRLFQALVAANADHLTRENELSRSLEWLERQEPPLIVAPPFEVGSPYYLSVPNNAMDLVGKAWTRGNYYGSGDANPATHRTMKSVRPIHLREADTIRYLWKLADPDSDGAAIEPLKEAASRIVALGWGIDLVVGQGQVISSTELGDFAGERWSISATGPSALRIPIPGTLSELRKRYNKFLHRMGKSGFVPVDPLRRFRMSTYRRPTDPRGRPYAVFELRHSDGSFCRYSQRKLIHIAGMVRNLAIERMKQDPPPDIDDPATWIDRCVAGHARSDSEEHRQFSYLPLPSIGHEYADLAIRRVMITAPPGADHWLEHLAQRLTGWPLIPDPQWHDPFGDKGLPVLQRVLQDGVIQCYTNPSNRWVSVTPVILPGHDDRKPAKTRKLIDTALAQAGIELPCTYEWSAHSCFRNALSAHKYDRDKHPIFFKPRYLQSLTSVHLTLTFRNHKVPGPLAIGAGRHCGFGIMASPP